MKTPFYSTITFLLTLAVGQATLVVRVDEPKRTAEKAVVKLNFKNTFKEKIESARATIFLLDANNKIVGQSTAWIIGGTKDKPALPPDATTTYNFVVSNEKPFTATKLSFSRLVLENGKAVDPLRNVETVK